MSMKCVNIFLMEAPPHDQTRLGKRRGGIRRREKRSRVILSYHLSLASQIVSGNRECAADASQSNLQRNDRYNLAAIDTDFCHRSIPLEISENLSSPPDITDSAQKSINISSCDPTSDGDREITMEDFLELEEFLELEDGEKLEDLDSSREVTMEDFMEPEKWLEDMDHNSKKKLDDDQHTSRGDLETSPKATIDRHQPDGIDRQPPHIIDQHPPYIIDRQSSDSIDLHPHSIIDRHPPDCIDRHPLFDGPHGYIVEQEQVEERVHESEASHNADSKHQRPPIWTEEAVGFQKNKGSHLSSDIEVLDDHQHVEASLKGLRFRDEVDKGPAEAVSINTDRIPSIDINKPTSIDATTSPSINNGRVSEQKEFDVCENLRDGETTTRSDKSGGKKRRNWKKIKRIMGDSQLSLIPRFSHGVRKSIVCIKCFSQPFAKLRALPVAEMIDKGEKSKCGSFITAKVTG
ncbi:hypothetical protein F2Q69_00022859 [Brassica cretica]|uniref:Uncharacterized protein n=1 Tax=Brassica cretica TaxID=69181 RepID=A0A8S9PZC0_BRACR|nr:hypothetical protein F2Q69_00022859 [Brassica cretica]